MHSYLSKKAKSITPYAAGEQPAGKMLKLNTNENPYPPSPHALAAAEAAFGRLRLYPDPDAKRLRESLAEKWGLTPESVFCGNGSDEVLALAFQTFFDPGQPLLMPSVTYSFYPVYAELYSLEAVRIPMLPGLKVDTSALLQPAGGVVLANPNAPTGIALPHSDIERILEAQLGHCLVLVDEAYAEFSRDGSCSKLVERWPNLLVIGTLSKSHALAGLRVGYALGQPELIDGLTRIKNSFNSYPLDAIAQAAAEAAVRDGAYTAELCRRVISSREFTAAALKKLGFDVLTSETNFIFARHGAHDAALLFARLRERGILVRHFPSGETRDYLRITIGTQEDMEAVISALEEITRGE